MMSTTTLLLILIVILMGILIVWLLMLMARLNQMVLDYKDKLAQKDKDMLTYEMAFEERLKKRISDATKRSNDTQRNVIKGQIGEQFAPFIADFPYNPSDCKFMGDPIDYIIFQNLHECCDGNVPIEEVQLIIAEVKTGANARLNQRQKIVKQAIEQGQVSFRELRVIENSNQTGYVIKVC